MAKSFSRSRDPGARTYVATANARRYIFMYVLQFTRAMCTRIVDKGLEGKFEKL